MTNKEIVQNLLQRIPNDTSLQEIAHEFVYRVDHCREPVEICFWHAARATPQLRE